jgi:hypothetical protein
MKPTANHRTRSRELSTKGPFAVIATFLTFTIVLGNVALRGSVPPPAGVPQTGQTKCWPTTGINPAEIPCAGTGQDGELQTGLPRSYTDNGDGTITDNVTGLMWEKLVNLDFIANTGDLHDADNTFNPWTAAFQKIADVNTAHFAGYSDWRLPNIKELRSLVFFGKASPAVDPAFNDVGANSRTRPTGTYWSSTTFPSQPFQAWSVGFSTGISSLIPKTSTATAFCCFVRAVRGPALPSALSAALSTTQTQCWDSRGAEISCAGSGQDGEFQKGVAHSYVDNADGTITDAATGLMWEKLGHFDAIANAADPHDVDNTTYTWAQAFQKISDLNVAGFAGHNDWRLPNINELESIAIFGKVTSRLPGPEIPAVEDAFDNGVDSFTRPNGYWSSTTGLSLTGQANAVSFLGGNVFFQSKTQPFANGAVRAVRGPVEVVCNCATDVTGSIAITFGGFTLNPITKRYVQTGALENVSADTIAGPLSLVLDNLSSNATLFNATGTTALVPPAGSPYVNANVSVAPGQRISIVLQFINPTNSAITYQRRVLAGPGAR